jgi:hypothetical protein
MALEPAVQGDRHTGQQITWYAGSAKKVLTNATLTGKLVNSAGTVTAIAGTLTVTDGPNGVFTWAYAAADVATVGTYTVQFTATFPDTLSDSSFDAAWSVLTKH